MARRRMDVLAWTKGCLPSCSLPAHREQRTSADLLQNAKLLGNLVYIFASLQKYNGDHVDPSELVQALDLDKDIQQDAGE